MNITELARRAGFQHPDAVGECENFAYFDLKRFAALVIEAEHKRLLAESGEPVAHLCQRESGFYDVLSDKACKQCFPVYTADQKAAAVLRYKQDAERYRWLTSEMNHEWKPRDYDGARYGRHWLEVMLRSENDNIHEAIDAAMKGDSHAE